MPTESLEVSHLLPVRPERIYRAWLDAEEHSQFTGGAATVDPRVGGAFTAWDGYIEGKNLVLEPHRRIVQSWRSSDFPSGSADSTLEILLDEAPGGTRITLRQSEIPEGQGSSYESGWAEHYFDPMTRYFSSPASRLGSAATQARAALDAAGTRAGKAMKAVKKTARKAAKKVKALAKTAQRSLGKKKKPARKVAAKKPARKPVKAKRGPSRR